MPPAFAARCLIRLYLKLLLFLTPALLAAAPSGTAASELSARTTGYDDRTGEVVMTGEARFTDGEVLIEANEIRYQATSGLVVASGAVRFTRGAQRILADQITYRRTDRTFTLTRPRLGSHPYYLSGRTAGGTPDRVVITDATASIREPGPYQPTLKAAELTYEADGRISATHARLGVGSVQPVSLPRVSHRLNLPFISYVSLSAGYRSSLGLFGEAGMHFPFSEDTRLGASLGLYTKRGLMVGPSAHYELDRDGRTIHGDLKSGFINDRGDRLTDVLGRAVPAQRGYVQWWHAQEFTEQLKLTAQLNYWRDSEILRDFRPQEFYAVQEPDSYLEAIHTGTNAFSSLFLRVQPNSYHRVQERLPEISFELLPQALAPGIYHRFRGSFAALQESPPGGGATQRSDRFDAYYAVQGSLAPRPWLSFAPVLGGRLTHYARGTGGRGDYTRALGEIGLDGELRGSAVFDYKNEIWKIDGLRHLVTPSFSYRYVPNAERGRAFIPPIDRRTFMTYLPTLGLGDIRHIDDLGAIHTLRLGVDNTLQTRDTVYGSRDLLVFNLAADLRLDDRPAGERRLSSIHAGLNLTPAPWLEFELYQSFSTQQHTLQEFNTGVTLRDGDAWALRFSSHYLRGQIEEYVVSPRLRLNEAYETVARFHYDARQRRFNEQAFGLRQNLHNTWIIEYLATFYDGPRRESSFGLSLRVEVLGF